MKAKVAGLMLTTSSPKSPLAEHIRGIVRRNDFRPAVETRRMLIISDLHQNSDAYSNYKRGLAPEPFIEYLDHIEFPDLSKIELSIFRIDRASELSPPPSAPSDPKPSTTSTPRKSIS